MTAQEAIKLIKTFESGKPSFDADFTEISKDCAIYEAVKALENQEIMKQAIYKAGEEIQKILDYPHCVLSPAQFYSDLHRIQDELVGVLED